MTWQFSFCEQNELAVNVTRVSDYAFEMSLIGKPFSFLVDPGVYLFTGSELRARRCIVFKVCRHTVNPDKRCARGACVRDKRNASHTSSIIAG